jgi:two-component system sensor histidine kinase/response regulator
MAEQTYDANQITILVVDDTPSNLQALFDLLITQGYRLREARDGHAALNMVADSPPDLILLDIYMPDMDGYEVCRRLKANARTRDIPVMFISALSDTENIVKGFEVGGVDYITKPFQFREVLARVASQLTLVEQRKQIEALRAKDRQYFESLNRMKDQFIQMATHDLRNPLNVILGYANVINRLDVAGHDQALRAQAVTSIQQSVDKMRTLVTDLLDLAQFETRSYLSITPVPLGAFLEKCLGGLHVIAIQKNTELVYTPPPDEVIVRIDESYMARVIDNLVLNAIKYTPGGGRVKVTGLCDAETVTIEVTDTGLGIPEEDLPHIFDAFYRVRHSEQENVEGSGLGLSIVKTIVEQHGGKVDVQSDPGHGSTFRVVLPRWHDEKDKQGSLNSGSDSH